MFYRRGYNISARSMFLLGWDIAVIITALFAASVLRFSFVEGMNYTHGIEYVLEHIPTISGSCFIFLLLFYIGGLYEPNIVSQRANCVVVAFACVLVGVSIIILVFYIRFNPHLGRGVMGLASLFVFAGVLMVRSLYRLAVGQGFFSRPTLIVGEGEESERVISLIGSDNAAGYRLFGVVSARSQPAANGFIGGIPVLGTIDKLREFVNAYSIETIVVATQLPREHKLLHSLRPLRYAGIRLMDFVSLTEELAQEIPVDHIDDEWLMHAAMNSSRIHIRKMKRTLDVSVALVGLVLSMPICLVAMIAIKLDSRGSIFFRQRRSGLEGIVYTLIKFRTMNEDAEAECGAVWAGKIDQRVTRVGRFLRSTRIDEIPQLINVLRGQMSLVGPRPERPEFVETLTSAIPFYRERLMVPPGITGWAQVKYPYAASLEAARKKLQYDLFYIKHMSLMLDISILLRTFKTIIVGMHHSEALDIDESGVPSHSLNVMVDGKTAKTQKSA